MTTTTTTATPAETFAQLVRSNGWRVELTGDRCCVTGKVRSDGYVLTIETTFAAGDTAAYLAAEREIRSALGLAPMNYPGTTWGTDSASVGGHAGLTGGYCRLSKSGVGGRFMSAAAKQLGTKVQYRR